MKSKAFYSDFLEESVGNTLQVADIRFIHESESASQTLDFYLPDHGVYIEVKQYYSDRTSRQLQTKDEVIVLQGKKSVAFFNSIVKKLLKPIH